MYIIKVSTQDTQAMMLRQTPGCKGIWRNYEFHINDNIKEADFWVVYGKGRKINEECLVPKQNLIFGSGEPDSVYRYASRFLKQFNVVFGPSKIIKCRNRVITPPLLAWYIGVRFNTKKGLYALTDEDKAINPKSDYDYFKTNEPLNKTKLLSIACSNLAITAGHQRRIHFVEKLKEHYGDKIDIFGRGFNPIDDKWEGLRNYKYHIAIENNVQKDYWSEKFSDAVLAGCYPIYYGCPNMNAYFPEESYSLINIENEEESFNRIDSIISDNLAEKRKNYLIESRNLILDKYNFFNVIADICDKLDPNTQKENVYLRHELDFINLNKFLVKGSRIFYNLKNKL